MGLKVILWFPQASWRWLPRLVAAIFITPGLQQSVCRYKYKDKQWPELSLSASDIPLGESVPQLPSLFPTAHYHFTYPHQSSCYGEHKAKYHVFEISRGWALSNVSSRGCVAAQATTDHWQWPGGGSTNKVDQDKSVGQNSELFLVPNCLLSPGPRPDLSNPRKWSENVI